MPKRWDYKICPYCGAALDPGEKCDCLSQKPKPPAYCVFPQRKDCRGCNNSYYPELYDSGCKLAATGGRRA